MEDLLLSFFFMKSVNKVCLLGNVTRDPELKATQGGRSVASFGLATNRVWRDAKGEKQSLPEYHNIVVWGGLAEFSAQYIKKGKPLYVEGYLKTRSWENAEGAKLFRTEIVVDNVVLLGSRDPAEAHIDHAEEALEEAPVLEEEPELVVA